MNKLLCDGLVICWRLVALSIGIGVVTHVSARAAERALFRDEECEHVIIEEAKE